MQRNNQSFAARMAEAKEAAVNRRYRGETTGKSAKGWKVKRAPLSKLEWTLQSLETEFETFRHEWQYKALAAVESALFAPEYDL